MFAYYCKPLSEKKKDFFCLPPDFFPQLPEKDCRRGQNPQDQQQAVPPEVPQGAQGPAEQGEIQRRPRQDADDHVDPQQPPAEGQCEIERAGQDGKAEQRVGQGRAPGAGGAAQAAQQVVAQAQRRAQQQCGEESRGLGGDLELHQPNRRLSSPPRP